MSDLRKHTISEDNVARTIYGKITDQHGQPVKGLKVEAWDSDWPDDDDRMGLTYTNSDGDYRFSYRGGHWDTAPHNITTWRPDIYVTVSIKNRAGRWTKLNQSKIYKNHKLKKDLRVDLQVQIAQTIQKRTSFVVSKHGFKFPNSFVVRDLFGISGRWHMGFCGGMSAGALHRFNHGCEVPSQTTTPLDGDPLFEELMQRQLDSLPVGVIAKILEWQNAPDLPHLHTAESLRHRQKAEWRKLQEKLDNGTPAVLVLIREEGIFGDLTKNHQVLAIGYEYNPSSRDLTVEVYDPNDTAGSSFLYLCLGGGRLAARQEESDGTRVRLRAFFVNPAGTDASKKHYG